MSPAELHIQAITEEITVRSEVPSAQVVIELAPDVIVLTAGNVGPPGPPGPSGQWESLTQAEYDALSPPDPETLYVIVE